MHACMHLHNCMSCDVTTRKDDAFTLNVTQAPLMCTGIKKDGRGDEASQRYIVQIHWCGHMYLWSSTCCILHTHEVCQLAQCIASLVPKPSHVFVCNIENVGWPWDKAMYSIMRQKITESRSTTLSPGHSQFFMLPALGGYKSTNLIYIEGDCYQSA